MWVLCVQFVCVQCVCVGACMRERGCIYGCVCVLVCECVKCLCEFKWRCGCTRGDVDARLEQVRVRIGCGNTGYENIDM